MAVLVEINFFGGILPLITGKGGKRIAGALILLCPPKFDIPPTLHYNKTNRPRPTQADPDREGERQMKRTLAALLVCAMAMSMSALPALALESQGLATDTQPAVETEPSTPGDGSLLGDPTVPDSPEDGSLLGKPTVPDGPS